MVCCADGRGGRFAARRCAARPALRAWPCGAAAPRPGPVPGPLGGLRPPSRGRGPSGAVCGGALAPGGASLAGRPWRAVRCAPVARSRLPPRRPRCGSGPLRGGRGGSVGPLRCCRAALRGWAALPPLRGPPGPAFPGPAGPPRRAPAAPGSLAPPAPRGRLGGPGGPLFGFAAARGGLRPLRRPGPPWGVLPDGPKPGRPRDLRPRALVRASGPGSPPAAGAARALRGAAVYTKFP